MQVSRRAATLSREFLDLAAKSPAFSAIYHHERSRYR